MECYAIENVKKKYSEKNHRPACAPAHDNLKAAVVSPFVKTYTSIVVGDNGKKKFEPTFGTYKEPSPTKKLIPRKEYSEETVLRGKKLINPSMTHCISEVSFAQRKHMNEEVLRRSGSSPLPTIGWTKKRHIKMPEGIRLSHFEEKIYNLESAMNRKQRVASELKSRNFIPKAWDGDKSYKNAEHETGFFESGGLIIGSSNQLRKSAKPSLRKGNNGTTGGRRLEATYKTMIEKRAADYDRMEVRTLTAPTTRLGEPFPSWEERTGNWLVQPEDDQSL